MALDGRLAPARGRRRVALRRDPHRDLWHDQAIQTYAANNVAGLSVPSSAFSVTTASCGAQVSAAYTVPTFTSGLGLPNITVHVSACYPI